MQKIGGAWEAASLKGCLIQAGWGADMGFPGLVISQDGEEIQGHVFASNNLERHWAALDEFEGVEYQRVLATVTLVSGSQIEAYVYVLR